MINNNANQNGTMVTSISFNHIHCGFHSCNTDALINSNIINTLVQDPGNDNDQLIEKEITDLIESTKFNDREQYLKLFEDGNFITQSVIHVNLEIYDEQLEYDNKENINKLNKSTGEYGLIQLQKLDLFRIFNDFTSDDNYPFIQYQIPDGEIILKYY